MPSSTTAMFRFPHSVQAVLQQIRQGLGIEQEQQSLGDATALLDDRDRWVEDNLSSLDDRLTAIGGDVGAIALVPPGSLFDFAGATVPAGWLACNGAAVLRADYPKLFVAIGVAWGAGNGTTTFNVPDLRGRASIGAGTGAGLSARALAAKGGEENHLLTGAESGLPSHNHPIYSPGNGGTLYSVPGTSPAFDTLYASFGQTAGPANAGSSHNTMQPFAVVTKIIKV